MQDQAVRLRNEVAGRNRKSIKRINCSFRLGLGSLFMFKSRRKSIAPDSSRPYRGWSESDRGGMSIPGVGEVCWVGEVW